MDKWQITTDSNCDLYETEYALLGVERGKLNFTIEENDKLEEYLDDFKSYDEYVEFYSRLKNGAVAKTTILNLQAHIDLFEGMAQKGVKKLLHISQSKGLSPTIDNANRAIEEVKQKHPDIDYVAMNSNTTTVGEQILVRYACKLRDEGVDRDVAVKKLNDLKNKIQHFIVVSDLMYLKRGGRIGGVAATLGSMLALKPIIEFSKAGKLEIVRKEMGQKKAFRSIVEGIKNCPPNKDFFYPIIVHTNAEDDARVLQKMIKDAYGWEAEIRIMGPIIGAHVGPGAVAIAYPSECERAVE